MSGRRGLTLEQRFMSKVEKLSSGCWRWTDKLDSWGYGRLCERTAEGKYRATLAHHISWKLFKGDIPPGTIICHKCNNSWCVNPRCLYAGSHKSNFEDQVKAGRYRPLAVKRGEEHPMAKLTDVQVRQIRRLVKSHSQRQLSRMFEVSEGHISALVHRKLR